VTLAITFILILSASLGTGDAVRGKALFRTCASCHNVMNDERRMGPSLRTLFGRVTLHNGRRADDENVRAIVLDGYNGMPPFRYSFRPSEIDDLMAYLHTLTGKPAQNPATRNAAGDGYFRSYCLRCHNPDSRSAAGPDLRGRFQAGWANLIDDGHAGAPAMKEWLDASGRQALLDYLKAY